MADEEHLKIIKRRVKLWNRWREDGRVIRPDLSRADLIGANLSRANLSDTDLTGVDLTGANLSDTDLTGANLSRANLSDADLSDADLFAANLCQANLTGANLNRAILRETNLFGANLSEAKTGRTLFVNLDLSVVNGLENIQHTGPSTICIETVNRSGGVIPEAFLRGCGLNDQQIKAIELYSQYLN